MPGWAIDGPSDTAVADARRMVYAATGGEEGVATNTALTVLPLSPPGAGVQLLPGTATIRSRYLDPTDVPESYAGSLTPGAWSELTVTQTPSDRGRSDMVVMLVEDPYAENTPHLPPEDPATAEYFPLRVLEGVPPTATKLADVPGYATATGVALARLDIPKNTATIAGTMIKDLRRLPQPKRADAYLTRNVPVGESGKAWHSVGSWQVFPPNLRGGQVVVPEWATWVELEAVWAGVWAGAGVSHVDARVAISLGSNPIATTPMGYFDDSPSRKTLALVAMGGLAIPPEMRGTTIYITPDIRLSADQAASALPEYHQWAAVRIRASFYESKADQIVAV